MSKVISPIMTDGTGMAIAQAINHATAVQLALNTASYDEDGTLLEVQDARTVNETQYASLGEAIRTEVTRIDNEKEVQAEALEGHADRITAVENKANTNATNISKVNDRLNSLVEVDLMDKCESVFTPTSAKAVIKDNGKHIYLTLQGSLNTSTGDTNILMFNGNSGVSVNNLKWSNTIAYKLTNDKGYIDKLLYGYVTTSRLALSIPSENRNTPIELMVKLEIVCG